MKRKTLLSIIGILLIASLVSLVFLIYTIKDNETEQFYLASDEPIIMLKGKEEDEISLSRGTLVDVKKKKAVIDETEYCQIKYEDKIYYIAPDRLVTDVNECVLENQVYALRDHVLTKDYDDFHISGWVKKNDQLTVSGFHELLPDGKVDYYYINDTGYIANKYVGLTYEETGLDSSIYKDVFYGMAGDPRSIDYYDKEPFNPEGNRMPDIVKALYINAEQIRNADEYIEIADRSSINAFVVDIKDCYIDTQLAYDSKAGKIYAPSTENIPNSYETYKTSIKKLKDAGYYLIGRITAFKDDSFAKDNPDDALTYNDELYRYGGVNWPSVYSRRMWEYNLALASEAVDEFGFNEIQFDYIRFPEDADETIETNNIYNETRAEVVTNFLRYAVEYLHQKNVYVSADVFGETSGNNSEEFSCFVAYYGQFWPAVSNAVDVISSMPYPDHFGSYYYGVAAPWAEPGALMTNWAKATYHAQDKTYAPAKCRTWIMAQDSDGYGIYYGAEFIKDQIDGLKAGNVYDGFMTWNAGSNTYKYNEYIEAFD